MLHFIRQGTLAICATLLTYVALAQIPKDPTHWRYEAKKINEGEYQLIFTVHLDDKWHVWSTEPGGDGSLIPTSFRFEKNQQVQLQGSIKELGTLRAEKMEFIEGNVRFYADSAVFIQHLTAPKGIMVKGQYEYQVCNDIMCLPPISKVFSVVLP